MHVCANPNGAFPFRTHNETNSDTWRKRHGPKYAWFLCVCVFVYVAICSRDERRVAVRVHFIVWGRSPVLKGALYWGSEALDGAKNLSLRAGTDSQCIVGLLHLSFGILFICWRTRSAGFQSADAGGINTDELKFLARMNACFFLEMEIPCWTDPCKWIHTTFHPGRRSLKVPWTTV